jgi:4-hydroxybutyryl-CoA dehydratase/vinylacetyl-CoA-Delta-isomerase
VLTGEQYVASLDDDRRTYIDGRQIKDLVTDPTTRIAVELVAKGYDTFHSSEPGARNPLLTPPKSVEALRDIVGLLRGVDMLAHTTFTSVMTLLTVLPQLDATYPELAERVRKHLDFVADNDLRVTEAITDAKGHRALPPGQQADQDAYVRVVERRPDGVVIRGAKLHITGASLAHELFVMPTKKMSAGEEDYAIACAVPADAPGVSTINTTYAFRGEDDRHYPMSRKRQMPDCFVIFDDVFVPNERIFLDGQTEFSAIFAHSLGLWERLGGVGEMAHDADMLVGLAQLIAEANGSARISHVREKIDEMMIHASLLRAGLEAALLHAHSTPEGYFYPDDMYTNVTKYQGAAEFNRMVRHLHDIAGGSVVTAPSSADFDNPQLRGFLEKYMSTGPDVAGSYRAALFRAIRDLTADSYGGWHQVTNLQSGGGLYAQRLVTRRHYDLGRARDLALRAAGLVGEAATAED